MTTLDRRIAALETVAGPVGGRTFLFVSIHGEELRGVRATEHWPAMDREAGESERAFMDRVSAIADERLPHGYPAVFLPRIGAEHE
jgi:hypothetical protein